MHTPNHISITNRILYLIFSLFIFSYGTIGIKYNNIYIPGARGRGINLHDTPAWIMYGSIICACLVMLSVIVDHYDKRDNERFYEVFKKLFKYLGLILFCISLYIFHTFSGVFITMLIMLLIIQEIPKVKDVIESKQRRLFLVIFKKTKSRPVIQRIMIWVLIWMVMVVGAVILIFLGLLLVIYIRTP